MEKLSPQKFSETVSRWDKSRTDLPKIKTFFGKNAAFNLHYDDIQEIKDLNKNDDFCVMISVSEIDELFMIPVPLDDKGNLISLDGYAYSQFQPLEQDLCLKEKQTFTIVKKSVLSTKMRKTDSDSDIFFPTINKPVMEQEKAL